MNKDAPMDEALRSKMRLPAFPLSAKYDLGWMVENEMGPSSVWLAEFLLGAMRLEPGMKVLDLGCGKAMSSIFLAKEVGCRVFATDLWIGAGENQTRIEEAGVAELVYPIHAEAHDLPYARGFFDAVVSLDSYHYYGTDERYLEYIASFLKPGGRIGVVCPGVARGLSAEDEELLGALWEPEFHTFKTPAFWRSLWERSRLVEVETADELPRGYEVWLHWDKTLKEAGLLKRNGDVAMLEKAGGNFTFVRAVGRKRG